jgi:5-methylcytosine-specific restriction endonuclease McrA
MFRVHAQQGTAQLSLFPAGSLVTKRQHHANGGNRYRVRMATEQWRCERFLALERDGFRCTNCGSEAALVVHHTSYNHVGDEWPEDLTTLCRDCHTREHERRAA